MSQISQTDRAIARLPGQSSASVEQALVNARRLADEALVGACVAELELRGTMRLTEDAAKRASNASAATAGKSLAETIGIAFESIPAKPEEVLILRAIRDNPGISFAELLKLYRKNDLSLVIGHLVYYRFGYFRNFLTKGPQSDALLERDDSSGKVCYTLRAETVEGLGSSSVLAA